MCLQSTHAAFIPPVASLVCFYLLAAQQEVVLLPTTDFFIDYISGDSNVPPCDILHYISCSSDEEDSDDDDKGDHDEDKTGEGPGDIV
jgi:hypothetical protein